MNYYRTTFSRSSTLYSQHMWIYKPCRMLVTLGYMKKLPTFGYPQSSPFSIHQSSSQLYKGKRPSVDPAALELFPECRSVLMWTLFAATLVEEIFLSCFWKKQKNLRTKCILVLTFCLKWCGTGNCTLLGEILEAQRLLMFIRRHLIPRKKEKS